ncbi:hypothetical protein pm098_46210 [Escherichia coli]|nr:hypothetical protein pm098_46210 [Escherichia coli]
MKKNTRFAFNAYLQQLARLNGVAVEELSSKFTVEPSVQQTLEDQIQQSAAFLTLINVTPVPSSLVSCWGWVLAAPLPEPLIPPRKSVSLSIRR